MSIPKTTTSATLTPEEIFGMPIGALDIATILMPGANPNEVARQKAEAKMISRNPETWLDELLQQKETAGRQRYFDKPTPLADLREAVLKPGRLRSIVSKDSEDLWIGLDQILPGWAGTDVMATALTMDCVVMFDWLGRYHPDVVRETFGIVPSPAPTHQGITTPAQWEIERTADAGRRKSNSEWGGKKLIQKISRRAQEGICGWLWAHVREMKAYKTGDSQPWEEIVRAQYGDQRSARTLLGRKFVDQVVTLIDEFEYRASDEDGPDGFLGVVRPWLDCPLFRDAKVAAKLLPLDCDITRGQLALSSSDTSAVSAMLDDPACAPGYKILLRMKANMAWQVPQKLEGAQSDIGWEKKDFSMGRSNTHGLVEAALLVGTGVLLKRLLDDPNGVRLIQNVLKEPIGPMCLAKVGTRMGWRRFGGLITDQADAWRAWKDPHGNTISHWLSFAYNRLEERPAWVAHQVLARAFPEHMNQVNDQNHEPTSWMPRLHSERIAERVIQKNGRLSAEERAAKGPAKRRAL